MADITAYEMLTTIESSLASLSSFPERISLVNDERLRRMGYRMLNVKNYMVFFSVDKKNKIVNVERILYKRRNWAHII